MRFYKIPIFIPEVACPHQCLFCNQKSITGTLSMPSADEVASIISHRLSTIPGKNRSVEVAFFGGTFTGLPMETQQRYLNIASQFKAEGRVQGIRVSTRPDYISTEILELLKNMGVTTIELGAQSLHDEVLALSGRGHSAADVIHASKAILRYGINLGLQMMTGLPGDTPEKSFETAKIIADLGATETRIYPALVIRGTELENLYAEGKYEPQSLNDAVELCAKLKMYFESRRIKVLRVGLHPSEGLLTGSDLIAGPFHPAFGALVKSEIWLETFKSFAFEPSKGMPTLFVSPAEVVPAIGHKGSNRIWLRENIGHVEIKADPALINSEMYVHYR